MSLCSAIAFGDDTSAVSLPLASTTIDVSSSNATADDTSLALALNVMSTSTEPSTDSASEAGVVNVFSPEPITRSWSSLSRISAFSVYSTPGFRPLYDTVSTTLPPGAISIVFGSTDVLIDGSKSDGSAGSAVTDAVGSCVSTGALEEGSGTGFSDDGVGSSEDSSSGLT